jgi:hypothetical protein
MFDGAIALADLSHNRFVATYDLLRADGVRADLQSIGAAITTDLETVRGFPVWELGLIEAVLPFAAFRGLLDFERREIEGLAAASPSTSDAARSAALAAKMTKLLEVIQTSEMRGNQLRAAIKRAIETLD